MTFFPSLPSLPRPSISPVVLPRVYRLVDSQGNPHPVLDDHYESHEAAWAEAVRWSQLENPLDTDPVGIGVEVSTSNGAWRTIRYPGG